MLEHDAASNPTPSSSSWLGREPDNSELSYRGVVTSSEMDQLRSRFSDLLICPGLVGPFGRRTDEQGRLRLPGALSGVRDTNIKLQGWESKAQGSERDRLTWWAQQLEAHHVEPVKGIDLLNGLSIERWTEYRRFYKSITVSTANARYKARRRRQVLQEEAEAKEGRVGQSDGDDTKGGRQKGNMLAGTTLPADKTLKGRRRRA